MEKVHQSQIKSSKGTLAFVIDGGGSVIETGIKGDLRIPFDCILTKWTIMADQSGDIVIDIWADNGTNFPPTNDDTIVGATSGAPTLSSEFAEDETLDGWTTQITADTTLRINVDSCTTITRCTLQLDFDKD
jgi:hypothetical protein